MAGKLTWRKQPSERGLARVTQGVRGRDGRVDGVVVYHVRPASRHSTDRWYWYGAGRNTLNTGDVFPTALDAQADATRYHKDQP